jgi:NADH-quinone oxidoreductase subunit N
MEALKTIRPELLTLSQDQINCLTPYLVMFAGTVLAILLSVGKRIQPKWPVFVLSALTCIAAMSFSYDLISGESRSLFNGMMVSDSYSNFFNLIFLGSALLTIFASFRYLDHQKLQHPEYYVLVLFAAMGMMLMSAAMDLVVVFIALELMSISIYVLVGFRRADRKSNEAAMKYFILGSAASAVLLYGVALIYGTTGTTEMRGILTFVHGHGQGINPIFSLGFVMVLFGFLFKVASVPFHMWMPDVYEGAPVPVTGFMTTGLKAAAFATFVRVMISVAYGTGASVVMQGYLHHVLWVSCVLTMLLGNFVALSQVNLKRMLAYSSIAHTGYLLMGILSASRTDLGFGPVTMYLVVYSIMNLGAFVILTLLASDGDTKLNLHDLSGVSRRHPWLAMGMSVFLLSMAGMPPLAGFAAKYLLFYSAVQAGEIPLVVIGVLSSAVSVYYYLRVLVYMYMRDPVGSPPVLRVSMWSGLALVTTVVLTIQIGVFPERMVNLAKQVVSSLSY